MLFKFNFNHYFLFLFFRIEHLTLMWPSSGTTVAALTDLTVTACKKIKSLLRWTDLSLLGHSPQVGVPSRLVTHLPAPTADVTQRKRRFPGMI